MKIAFITELFYPHVGGMEVRHYEMAQNLVALGHQVDIYTLRYAADLKKEDDVGGIRIHRITDAQNYLLSIWGLRSYPDVIRFTFELIKRRGEFRGFDAIIFNQWPVLPAVLLPKFCGNRFVVDWCEIYDNPFWKVVYYFLASKKVFHSAINSRIYDYLRYKRGIPEEKVELIVSGIYSQKYACAIEDKENKNILFVGRLFEHKNGEFLIKAFLSAGLGDKKYRLNIAGDGPLFSRLQGQYHGSGGVYLHGHISNDEKSKLIKKASLLVVPSKREGFPIVCAEAAAAGTPTLTIEYPDNGTVSIIEKFGIGWVSSADIRDFSSKIEYYGDMENNEWKTASLNCKKAAETLFDWGGVIKKFINFLEKPLI